MQSKAGKRRAGVAAMRRIMASQNLWATAAQHSEIESQPPVPLPIHSGHDSDNGRPLARLARHSFPTGRSEAVYGRPGTGHIESMAILKIARMGHPVLSRPALPVADPSAPAIAHLIEDMVDTLVDANAAGLAAPQVHMPLRLVLFRVPPGRETVEEESAEEDIDLAPASAPESPTVLINPEIEPIGESMVEDMEACLSLPRSRRDGAAPRPHSLSLGPISKAGPTNGRRRASTPASSSTSAITSMASFIPCG